MRLDRKHCIWYLIVVVFAVGMFQGARGSWLRRECPCLLLRIWECWYYYLLGGSDQRGTRRNLAGPPHLLRGRMMKRQLTGHCPNPIRSSSSHSVPMKRWTSIVGSAPRPSRSEDGPQNMARFRSLQSEAVLLKVGRRALLGHPSLC